MSIGSWELSCTARISLRSVGRRHNQSKFFTGIDLNYVCIVSPCDSSSVLSYKLAVCAVYTNCQRQIVNIWIKPCVKCESNCTDIFEQHKARRTKLLTVKSRLIETRYVDFSLAKALPICANRREASDFETVSVDALSLIL